MEMRKHCSKVCKECLSNKYDEKQGIQYQARAKPNKIKKMCNAQALHNCSAELNK